jgi:hypothetical protein
VKYKVLHIAITWTVGVGALIVGYGRTSLADTPLLLSMFPGVVLIGFGEILRLTAPGHKR